MTNKNSKSYIDIELNEKWGTSTVWSGNINSYTEF